jgi:hypothetical protein
MAKQKIRTIDTKKERPHQIKSLKKKVATFKQPEIIVDRKGFDHSYMIFFLEHMFNKYLLEYQEVLTLLYLQYLGLFEKRIEILERKINLSDLIKMNYVRQEYVVNKKKLYCLTDKSLEIVKEFSNVMNNKSNYYDANRNVDTTVNNKIKSTLSSYFQ